MSKAAAQLAAAGTVTSVGTLAPLLDREPKPVTSGLASSSTCTPSPAGRTEPVLDGRRGHGLWAGCAEIEGSVELPVRLARCCLPLPGDAVVGFATHNSAVSLHRSECANAAKPRGGREPVQVRVWKAPDSGTFPTEIAVEAFDRYGLLADITEVLSDTSASVRAASTTTSDDRVAHARFTVEVDGPDQLAKVLHAVRGVGGVYDCYRAGRTTP